MNAAAEPAVAADAILAYDRNHAAERQGSAGEGAVEQSVTKSGLARSSRTPDESAHLSHGHSNGVRRQA